jgi:hypothetical protein
VFSAAKGLPHPNLIRWLAETVDEFSGPLKDLQKSKDLTRVPLLGVFFQGNFGQETKQEVTNRQLIMERQIDVHSFDQNMLRSRGSCSCCTIGVRP